MSPGVLASTWTELGDKIIALAESFPSERYDWQPTTGVRSVADQLRHLAFWNFCVAESLDGGRPDGSANELPREKYPGKPEIVAAVRDSYDRVRRILDRGQSMEGKDLANVIGHLGHGSEHYGQLVLHARLLGIVPPASR